MVDQTFRSTVPYERAKDARDPERGNDVVKMVVPLLIGALLGWGISEMMDRPDNEC